VTELQASRVDVAELRETRAGESVSSAIVDPLHSRTLTDSFTMSSHVASGKRIDAPSLRYPEQPCVNPADEISTLGRGWSWESPIRRAGPVDGLGKLFFNRLEKITQ
jgi:hypothetical protein